MLVRIQREARKDLIGRLLREIERDVHALRLRAPVPSCHDVFT